MKTIYPKEHLVDIRVSAKFDEIAFMPLQNTKQKPKRHGFADGLQDVRTTRIQYSPTKQLVGIIKMFKKNFYLK